jgi:predicted nucleic acid-binding protein
MDVLMNREPHVEHSSVVLKRCGKGVTGCIAASQTTDIFYLLRKENKSDSETSAVLKKLTTNLTMLDVTGKDVNAALDSSMSDFEDALAAQVANRAKINYIVTRNPKDFKESPVSAMLPANFIDKYFRDI